MTSTLALCRLFAASLLLCAAFAAPAAPPAPADGIIRIRAGVPDPLKDETGQVWLGDQGFEDGETMHRPGLAIGNTRIPSLYCGERFNMSKFSHPVPNGNYVVKLHFAITYEAITGPGEVVFSLEVEGKPVRNLDIWAKAGGANRAHIESVPLTVADGKLDIAFIAQKENPTISGIEIVPAK